MFCRSQSLGFHVFSTEHSQNFSQILSVGAGDNFECLQPITTPESVEVAHFVFIFEMIVDFQTCSRFVKTNNVFVFLHYYQRDVWYVSSWSESFSLMVWQTESTVSGHGSFKERSQRVPGFFSLCSWIFGEQLWNKSELVGSEEIHRV